MLKKSTNNTFDKGLLMDFNPIVTPNNVLTNCLNGTIITYNGNEYVLQNDMGNGRVETAYLPEGYIPMGTAELGGIIYIVSYNPLKGVCQIGSFPSPERNLTSDEFQEQTTSLSISNFYKEQKDSYTYEDSIISTQQRLILSDKFIYPGDKFQISSIDLNPSLNYLSAFCTGSDKNQYLNPKYLKLSVISISEEGKYENLNDNLIWYPLQDENSESDTEYYIRNIELGGSDEGKVNLDEYRSLTQSNYNIFQGTEKGKLGILAELECIDTFSCGYNISQEVYPSDNTQIRYSPKLYLNWTYTNPINSNKINLYGVRVRLYQEGVDALDKTQYIIIPAIYSVNGTINGGDFDICKYPNEVEFLNYNSDIPSELKSDLTKIAEFGAATDQQEWIRLNQDWLRIKGWYTPTLTPNLLRGYIENYITTAKEYINQYLSPRQNNGDDSQIEIDLSTFNLSLDTINSNNILHLEVTPLMPFGAIEYLTQKYTLDLQKIGTGTFDFVRYQYQNYESENIMNIGINTYPEEGASFQDLSVEFYSLTQDIYDRLVDEDTNSHLYNGGAVFDNCNTIIQRGREVWANKKTALNPEIVCDVISNEDVPHVNNQYIGILTNNTTISLNPDNFADLQIDICKISFKYVKGKEVNTYTYYRIYYPGDIFNNVDLNIYNDFSVLKLQDYINCKITYDVSYPTLKRSIENNNLIYISINEDPTIQNIGLEIEGKIQYTNIQVIPNISLDKDFKGGIESIIENTQMNYTTKYIQKYIEEATFTIPRSTGSNQSTNFSINLHGYISFYYTYTISKQVKPTFELTPLKVGYKYIVGSGDKDNAWLSVVDDPAVDTRDISVGDEQQEQKNFTYDLAVSTRDAIITQFNNGTDIIICPVGIRQPTAGNYDEFINLWVQWGDTTDKYGSQSSLFSIKTLVFLFKGQEDSIIYIGTIKNPKSHFLFGVDQGNVITPNGTRSTESGFEQILTQHSKYIPYSGNQVYTVYGLDMTYPDNITLSGEGIYRYTITNNGWSVRQGQNNSLVSLIKPESVINNLYMKKTWDDQVKIPYSIPVQDLDIDLFTNPYIYQYSLDLSKNIHYHTSLNTSYIIDKTGSRGYTLNFPATIEDSNSITSNNLVGTIQCKIIDGTLKVTQELDTNTGFGFSIISEPNESHPQQLGFYVLCIYNYDK